MKGFRLTNWSRCSLRSANLATIAVMVAKDNYLSTTGWCFQLGGPSLLSWASRQQSIIARASTESELYAASDACIEAIHIRKLLNFMGHFTRSSVPIMVDNQSCIKQSVNTMDMRNARHYGRHAGWLRQRCKFGEVSLHYVPTTVQRADVLTKLQPRPAHETSCKLFNILDPEHIPDDQFALDKFVPQNSSTYRSSAALSFDDDLPRDDPSTPIACG